MATGRNGDGTKSTGPGFTAEGLLPRPVLFIIFVALFKVFFLPMRKNRRKQGKSFSRLDIFDLWC